MRPAVRFNRLAGPAAIVLLLVLVVAGCGRVPTNAVSPGQTASGERSPSPSSSAPLPSPTSDPTAGWQTFNSSNIGYSVKLPPTLKYMGSVTSGPDRADYFSNENAGAPRELDQTGIFFQIAATHDTGDQCFKHGLSNQIDRTDSLVIDGSPATMNILTWSDEEGSAPGIAVNTLRGGYCYEIVFVAKTAEVRDSYEQPALIMFGQTFRFGSGPTG